MGEGSYIFVGCSCRGWAAGSMAPGGTGQRGQRDSKGPGRQDCADAEETVANFKFCSQVSWRPTCLTTAQGPPSLPLLPEDTLGEALCQPTESISSLYFMLSEIASEIKGQRGLFSVWTASQNRQRWYPLVSIFTNFHGALLQPKVSI